MCRRGRSFGGYPEAARRTAHRDHRKRRIIKDQNAAAQNERRRFLYGEKRFCEPFGSVGRAMSAPTTRSGTRNTGTVFGGRFCRAGACPCRRYSIRRSPAASSTMTGCGRSFLLRHRRAVDVRHKSAKEIHDAARDSLFFFTLRGGSSFRRKEEWGRNPFSDNL